MSRPSLSELTWDQLSVLLEDLRIEQRDDRIEYLRSLTMPFGKHKGERLDEIPLKYLDATVSGIQPSTWFIRRVHEFVDLVMQVDRFSECEYAVLDRSFNQVESEIDEAVRTYHSRNRLQRSIDRMNLQLSSLEKRS